MYSSSSLNVQASRNKLISSHQVAGSLSVDPENEEFWGRRRRRVLRNNIQSDLDKHFGFERNSGAAAEGGVVRGAS
jgi:hypothetical protein